MRKNNSFGCLPSIVFVRSKWQTLHTKFPCRSRCSIRPYRRNTRLSSNAKHRGAELQTPASPQQNLLPVPVPTKYARNKAQSSPTKTSLSTSTKSLSKGRKRWVPFLNDLRSSLRLERIVLEPRTHKDSPLYGLLKSMSLKRCLKTFRKM